ncbi:MAG: RIP metalloprotease RseP [Gammaproteobacteria bacterium SG8_15]|nr:MAG: RIP metalloprotease RseP [Gammaproteobacteria bacterium SG8_15]
MSSFLTSLSAFIVAIGVLIAFHEFGHYWVARRCGVKVLRYSIGFGKPLWMRRHGDDQTEYVIAAIPLGGYVKMLDEREAEVPEQEVHRAFNRQPVSKRIAIVAAGPIFNFIFAIAAYALMYVVGVPGIKPVIGEVPEQSIAYNANIRTGDEIISVDGETTPTWGSARMAMLQSALQSNRINLELQDSAQNRYRASLPVDAISTENKQGQLMEELGLAPFRPPIPAVMGKLSSGGAAERDGLQTGDKILAVTDQQINDWEDWVNIVRDSPEKTLQVNIERQGEILQIDLTPEAIETETGVIGRIGALPEPVEYPKELQTILSHSPGTALYTAVVKTWQMSVLTLRMIGNMLIGEVSVKNLSGPITIATYAGYTASEGLPTFLSFLAIVSISLGVLNLLPIPLLDGGHLLFYFIEIVKGSALSEEAQLKMQHVGIVLLGMLMMLAFYNDIQRLFWG